MQRKKCPMDLAKSKGYDDIVKILEKHHHSSDGIENIDNTSLVCPTNATDSLDAESEESQHVHSNKKVNRRKRKGRPK